MVWTRIVPCDEARRCSHGRRSGSNMGMVTTRSVPDMHETGQAFWWEGPRGSALVSDRRISGLRAGPAPTPFVRVRSP